ncbi:MAG TPA: fatty acid desaturase [Burkholderiales bacterium]|jgi:stearoyl-CoA desaturase (delta-9 desaturase)|nr:fatty acid desaturase [Burkholderiales bacterium]
MNLNRFTDLPSWAGGLIDLPWWGYVLVALVFTHITIASVTIYLHRHSAHRALDLHPVVAHFFRLWLWLTTGMSTKAWTAIHRKHHAKCETEEDPHSPQVLTLKKVLLEGGELYRKEAKNQDTLDKYGHGTPDDWIERNVYSGRDKGGVALMLVVNILLFGPIGLTVWAVQMLWIPVTAAGVINGVGHFYGYRNFQVEDASTNIVPWGILIGGEELHNNHHAYASSARLSNKWYEFDIGWLYIRLMEIVGLADVKKLAPPVKIAAGKARCDLQTLQAVITHRYDVLARFTRLVKATCADELRKIRERRPGHTIDLQSVKRWLHFDAKLVPAKEKAKLEEVLKTSKVLDTVYTMRQELVMLWQRSTATKEQLLSQLEDWCRRAERSGIAPLREFSLTLRRYA